MDELIQDTLNAPHVESVTFARLDGGKVRCELTWTDGSVNRRSGATPVAALRSLRRAVNL